VVPQPLSPLRFNSRPTGDTPFATTGAPAPRERRLIGDAPSGTAGATAPWGRRPSYDASSVIAGATAPWGRRPIGDTPTANRWVAMPGCAPPEMRPAPRAAQQRRGGVASTAARLLRNGGRRPRGVPHWRGALAPTGLTVARGRRPTGDTPSSEPVSAGPGVCPTGKAPCATTGAPALQGRRRTGDAPSATTEVPGPRGVAPPATHPPPGTVHQHQGLSGYVFWAVIGYGYTPILRI